ncbi:STY1053 family phage-associated protein [Yersinia pseudotuberculosis]|uniref:STY1053 family phage-associated protein n=1 Tax=Yersinia pseudotuberculosis TaxID=633 RepID=UPI0005DEC963|nr:hypothetical protein [Yersinia pseudotuberculosis]CFV37540.1 Uncharacterised protein [Yersinia pseudotuberculosis]
MKIAVHTPFKLSLAGQPDISFLVGTHKVTKDVAEHWFTLAHAEVIDAETEHSNTDLQASMIEMQGRIDQQERVAVERVTTIYDLQKQLSEQVEENHSHNATIADLQKRLSEQTDEIDSRNANIVDLQNQIDELNKGKTIVKESKSTNGGKV